jgi:putative addiction module component (TIGR02574 family)
MPMTKEQILTHAMTLGAGEREALAEELLQSIAEGDRAALDAAWLAETRSREEAFARGEMSTSPLEDVLARVRSKAPR